MTTAKNILEALLSEHEVARITGLPVASVRRWRVLKQGPPYLKIGSAVRYKPEDLIAWLKSRPSGSFPEEQKPPPISLRFIWRDSKGFARLDLALGVPCTVVIIVALSIWKGPNPALVFQTLEKLLKVLLLIF